MNNLSRSTVCLFILALVFACSAGAHLIPPITMTECFSSAPNAYGSPSWNNYVSNAITGIMNGCTAVGDPTQPSYYQSQTVFDPGQLIVTAYNSWDGQVSPAAPFNNEEGNRLHDGLDVKGNGGQFSLSQLVFSMSSSDPANSLSYSGSFSPADSYSDKRVGIIYGPTPTYITSGPANQLVDELVYVGIGNAFCSGPPTNCGGGSFQSIDDLIDYMNANAPFSITNTYSIVDPITNNVWASVTSSAEVNQTPEPAALLLTGSSLMILGLFRRKKRA